MGDPTPTTTSAARTLSGREIKAMREMRELSSRGDTMGRRKIVSLQGCEAAGLVRRVCVDGLIADWEFTELGRAWKP